MNNHMVGKVWDESTYPFPNFIGQLKFRNGEVIAPCILQCISNLLMLGLQLESMLVTWALGGIKDLTFCKIL